MTYQHFLGCDSLDHVHPLISKSLRCLLTKAAPKDQPLNRMFLAMQASPGVIRVNFLLPNEHRVRKILKGLIPYAKYHFNHQTAPGTDINMQRNPNAIATATKSLFSPSSIEAAPGLCWCPIQDSIITNHDTYLLEIAGNKNPLFDFTGMEPMPTVEFPGLTPRETHVMD